MVMRYKRYCYCSRDVNASPPNVEVEPGGGEGGGPRSLLSTYPIEAAVVSPTTTTTRGHQDHLGTNIGLGGVRSSVLRGSALSGSHKVSSSFFE